MKNNPLKILVFFILSGICVYSVYRMNEINFIQDDAYITLRYVQNFINGSGLVFNIGERVEGYTNFLWVMILSLFGITSKIFSFQIDLAFISQTLSQLAGVALLVLSFFFAKRLLVTKFLLKSNKDYLLSSLLSLIPPLLISFSSPFLYWGVSGMESTLFTFLTLLSIYRYLFRNSIMLDSVFVTASILNSLLRPEGILIFLLIVIHSKTFSTNKLFQADNNSDRRFIGVHNKEIFYYIIPLLLFLLFRFSYFGHLLPNTFYAKTGFNLEHLNRGLNYVLSGISNNFFYGILLVIPLINFRKRNLLFETLFFYFFVFTYLVFIMLIGGDVLPVERFILPVLPLVIIFSFTTIYQLHDLSISLLKKSLLLIALTIILSFCIINSYTNNYDIMRTKRSYEVGLVKKMKVYADWIKKQQGDKENKQITVALSTIGVFSFFSEVKVIDIVGLTDDYIAHNPKEVPGIDEELPVLWKERRYNAEYVLKQNPHYIIFPAGAKPTAFAECAIFVQPEFYKNYYIQLIYSDQLKQLLPIFTMRENILQTNNSDCNVKFVKPYIEANNLFIEMYSNKKFELLSRILDKCDDAEQLCPIRKSDIDAVRGYSFYHYGDKTNAKLFFESSLVTDSLNMISRFYLMKIYNEEGDQIKMINQFKKIKKYSPDAIINNYIAN